MSRPEKERREGSPVPVLVGVSEKQGMGKRMMSETEVGRSSAGGRVVRRSLLGSQAPSQCGSRRHRWGNQGRTAWNKLGAESVAKSLGSGNAEDLRVPEAS